MTSAELLVIGAGPYALSVAARAREQGIETVCVGRPMAFWKEHMPGRMFLRSGPNWHLDAASTHTFEAYLGERRIAAADIDPIPIAVFLEYAEWFGAVKEIGVRGELVTVLAQVDGRFEATLFGGEVVSADAVVCAPGIRDFTSVPSWAADVPAGQGAHTCELVRFDDLEGARVLIVGGRQSAYEWAALIAEAGAERIDVVHRHDVPRFERVSWSFVDPHMDSTLAVPGWWRRLTQSERTTIARRFWEVGRLTLEPWLPPRLDPRIVRRRPGVEVATVETSLSGDVAVRLSDSERLGVDRIVFATGYRANLSRVPYLAGLLDRVELADGFPVLDESFETSLQGLYVTGFAATNDFGPFFGFVRGAPVSAAIIVDDLARRG
jgi:cation diffusion facilitator CzcD-associated flavoprotein CzcO